MPAVDYEKVAGLYDALVPEDMDARFFGSLSKEATSSWTCRCAFA